MSESQADTQGSQQKQKMGDADFSLVACFPIDANCGSCRSKEKEIPPLAACARGIIGEHILSDVSEVPL